MDAVACRKGFVAGLAAATVLCVAAVPGPLLAQGESPAPQMPAAEAEGDGAACKPNPENKKIYYGSAAPEQNSTVAIRYRYRGRSQLCTGVVISQSSVLTAGHCSCGENYQLVFGQEVDDVDSRTVTVPRGGVRRFPPYDCSRVHLAQPGRDLAVIMFNPDDVAPADVRSEFYSVARVMPPRVARRTVLQPGNSLKAVGYGRTETGDSGVRMAAPIPVMSWDCAEGWAKTRDCQSFSEFILSEAGLTGLKPGGRERDSCFGDSGGPTFAMSSESDSCSRTVLRSYLVGITSRGMRLLQSEPNKPCGGGGIYQVVARRSVFDWLEGLGVSIDLQSTVPQPEPGDPP